MSGSAATVGGASARDRYAPTIRTNMRALEAPTLRFWSPAWICAGCALLLSIIGIASIGTTEPGYMTRQAGFLCVAVMGAAATCVPSYRLLERWHGVIALVVLGMLVFVLVPAVPESIVRPRNGARRWINIGVTDLQPSELAKIAYVVSLAAYLRTHRHYRRFWGLAVPFALTFVPMGLIVKEPDLGTSLLFLPALFTMLLVAGSRLRHLAIIVALGVLAVVVVVATPARTLLLEPHQIDRIDAFYHQFVLQDDAHAQGIGYQGDKAMMLVGAGGWDGVGAEMAERLVDLNHLPEERNDMVFAVVVNRWGARAGVVTWILYLGFCLGALLVAATTSDPFGRLIAVGISAIVFAQMTVNTGMTIGVLPITGMNLPFVSYGGSSLVATWLMTGLVINIGLRSAQFLRRDAADFDTFEDPA